MFFCMFYLSFLSFLTYYYYEYPIKPNELVKKKKKDIKKGGLNVTY